MSPEDLAITIPISFLDETPLRRLAVNEAGLLHLLCLNDGRSPQAAKKAAYLFRSMYGIKTLPGGVYSIAAIRSALEEHGRDLRWEKRKTATQRPRL